MVLITYSIPGILFSTLIGGMILYGMLKNKKSSIMETLDISSIDSLSVGFCKIKGQISMIDEVESPLTKTKCIGYKVNRLSYNYGTGVNKKTKKWKTISSKTKCTDFYIEDSTGKIKVKSTDISIQVNTNKSEKKIKKNLIDVENLLLEDNTKYIIAGTISKNKDGSLELIRSKENNELLIMDELFYKFTYKDIPFFKKKGSLLIFLLITVIVLFIKFGFFLEKMNVSLINKILYWLENNNLSKGMLVILFFCINISIALFSSVIGYIFKPIKFVYNLLGPISTGSLMASFINVLFLLILLAIDISSQIILYSGISISLACYLFCLFYSDEISKFGKTSKSYL